MSSRSRCGSCPRSSPPWGSGRCRGTPAGGSPTTTRATCCVSCAISAQPRRLLGGSGAELVPFARPDLCCGFGGTFSVRQPEVSVAMADEKLAGGEAAGTIVTADPGLPDAPARPRRAGRLTAFESSTWRPRSRGASVAELAQPARRFRVIARGKLADAHTQQALDDSTDRLRTHRLAAWEELAGRRGAARARARDPDGGDRGSPGARRAIHVRAGGPRRPRLLRAHRGRGERLRRGRLLAGRARSSRRSRSRWRPRRSGSTRRSRRSA